MAFGYWGGREEGGMHIALSVTPSTSGLGSVSLDSTTIYGGLTLQNRGISFANNFTIGDGNTLPSSLKIAHNSNEYITFFESPQGDYTIWITPNVYCYGDINALHCYEHSDVRLKKNIFPSTVKALEALTAIDIKSFDWIRDDRHVDAGIIAQQLKEVAPNLVTGDEELAISTSELLNYCVKAIQELADMVGYKPKKKAEWTDPYTLEEKLEYSKLHSHI